MLLQVIQKLIEFGTDAHRDFLIQIMNGHIQNLSLNMYGCRVVQRVSVTYSLIGLLV
jgi:hypothetical protein